MDGAIYEAKKSKENSLKEIFIFYALFAVAICVVYKTPQLALLFFILLLAWAWVSRRNYFWITFFFLILQAPAYFFEYCPTSHLPFIKLFAGVSLTPIDIFTVLMFIKVIMHRRHIGLKLKTPLTVLGFYIIFSFFYGSLFYPVSLENMINFLRPMVYVVWIIFFTAFMGYEDIFKFIKLLFPIVFFIFFSQIYFLVNEKELVNLLDPYFRDFAIRNTLTGELRPVIGGVLALFMVYIGSFFPSQLFKEKIIRSSYLNFIMALSFLSIILSATRAWFAIFLFIFIGVKLKDIRKLSNLVKSIIFAAIIFSFLLQHAIVSRQYLEESAWARVSQIFSLAGRQEQKIDTLESRLAQLKTMLEKINENPFFGYGFSQISAECYNNNFGFFNTILMFGLFGFALFIFLFIFYFKVMRKTLKKIPSNDDKRFVLHVLMVSFVAILMGYFFTQDFFSLYYPDKIVFIMVFLGVSEVVMNKANSSIDVLQK